MTQAVYLDRTLTLLAEYKEAIAHGTLEEQESVRYGLAMLDNAYDDENE